MKNQLVATCLAAAALGIGGCNSNQTHDGSTPATVRIEASQREIVAGEIVTLIARTKDTYGRDAEVRWSSTAGKLSTEQDGRVARIRFDDVGTYTVKATLWVDGREVESDMVEVRVRPVS
ncbi:MAG TPA: hypothetical protein PL072_04110 [Phycisphaerales bacterium]|mgnify:FL=1|nr:hypothetical protein [Phycisphaerales bacterium]